MDAFLIPGPPAGLQNPAAVAITGGSGAFDSLALKTGASANATLIADVNGALSYIKNNLAATTNPAVTDDSAAGYSALSLWLNTSTTEIYRCLSAAVGAAVWEQTTLTLDDLGSMATQAANNVAITGGAIDGTIIGATTPAAGMFTNLELAASSTAPTYGLRLRGGVGIEILSAHRTSFGSGAVADRLVLSENGNLLLGYSAETVPASRLVVQAAGSTQRCATFLDEASLPVVTIDSDGKIVAANLDGCAIGATTPAAGMFTTVLVKGASVDGSTNCLTLQDSAGTAVMSVNTDGVITFGTDTNLYRSAADTLATDDDFAVGSTKAFHLGAPGTDGTWRIIRDGNNLLMQRRESGSYVTKQTISA